MQSSFKISPKVKIIRANNPESKNEYTTGVLKKFNII